MTLKATPTAAVAAAVTRAWRRRWITAGPSQAGWWSDTPDIEGWATLFITRAGDKAPAAGSDTESLGGQVDPSAGRSNRSQAQAHAHVGRAQDGTSPARSPLSSTANAVLLSGAVPRSATNAATSRADRNSGGRRVADQPTPPRRRLAEASEGY